MTGSRLRPAFLVGLFLGLLVVALQGVQSEELDAVPPEDLCRPYIEKALKGLGTGSLEQISAEIGTKDEENQQEGALPGSEEIADEPGGGSREEGSQEVTEAEVSAEHEGESGKQEATEEETATSDEQADNQAERASGEDEQADDSTDESAEVTRTDEVTEESTEIEEEKQSSAEAATESEGAEADEEDTEQRSGEETEAVREETVGAEEADAEKSDEQVEEAEQKGEESLSDEVKSEENVETAEDDQVSEGDVEDAGTDDGGESKGDETEADSGAEADDIGSEPQAEDEAESATASHEETVIEEDDSKAHEEVSKEDVEVSKEGDEVSKEEEEASQVEADDGEGSKEGSVDDAGTEEEDQTDEEGEASKETAVISAEVEEGDDREKTDEASEEAAEHMPEDGESEESSQVKEAADDGTESTEEAVDRGAESAEEGTDDKAESAKEAIDEKAESAEETDEDTAKSRARREVGEAPSEEAAESTEAEEQEECGAETGASEEQEPTPEEDLIQEILVPEHLRPRDHIDQLLKLDEENENKERAIQNMADIILRDLKRLYDNAIQPLETLYKYRDLSNRHFGDPEIFSKPLVLFMGPWSGGKSSIINYLLDIEYKQTSLRTGAEPSPAYFNIIMHGEEEEILDGTQLAADWTFSGLQKFGQGLLDRLRGLKLNNKLLEKVNVVEIPGILEVRKQVQRVFPFNDACQWFIDRADIIFLVYDPSKLDVGPETEAILDQLKGREYQTRIILNKADQVKPEELMRVQGALIWNISPLMSSAEPPIMYSTSLWSIPYEAGAPTRLLYAQERAFLRDLRSAIDKRVEHKIASARRFAVRVRNHAKMVDCYLTTYYNHKTFFGNKKEISDKIIENPQDYHIYEGLSTLTNISRYDLPDPDVYRDFFRLNALYDFEQLSATCTYFRGCPINRLDVAIAYDLPELVGKYKKSVEAVIHESDANSPLS